MGFWNYIYADSRSNFEDGSVIRHEDEDCLDIIDYQAPFKLLIPKEFGGSEIICDKNGYQGYGEIRDEKTGKVFDLYELIGIWNSPEDCIFRKPVHPVGKNTKHNRHIGIEIGCYDYEQRGLKYPLKLVHVEYSKKYEDCDGISYSGQF